MQKMQCIYAIILFENKFKEAKMAYTLDSFGNITRSYNRGGIKIDSFGNVFNSYGIQTSYKMPFGYSGPRQFNINSFGNPMSSNFGINLNKFPWQR